MAAILSRLQCVNVVDIQMGARYNRWVNGAKGDQGDFSLNWGRDKMAAVSQTMFSNAFPSKKMYEFRLKLHWSSFLMFQLTIFQHWFRYWLGAVQATSHYMNQWWLFYWRIYASLGLNELNDQAIHFMHLVNVSQHWMMMVWCYSTKTSTNTVLISHRSVSKLAEVMACCPMAPSHYLNRFWLIVSKVQWHSSEGIFARDALANKISFKFSYWKFHSNLTGANGLMGWWDKSIYLKLQLNFFVNWKKNVHWMSSQSKLFWLWMVYPKVRNSHWHLAQGWFEYGEPFVSFHYI